MDRIEERRIEASHSYIGLLTHYSEGWSHSLLRHGAPLFASPDLAVADFWATKERLPAYVHEAIFGHSLKSQEGLRDG
jgi:hypothetical protein